MINYHIIIRDKTFVFNCRIWSYANNFIHALVSANTAHKYHKSNSSVEIHFVKSVTNRKRLVLFE